MEQVRRKKRGKEDVVWAEIQGAIYIGEERLVKLIVEKLKESGGVGWREEYEMLLRKYGLEEAEEEEQQPGRG